MINKLFSAVYACFSGIYLHKRHFAIIMLVDNSFIMKVLA